MQSVVQLTLCTVEARLLLHTLCCCPATLLYSQLATGLTQGLLLGRDFVPIPRHVGELCWSRECKVVFLTHPLGLVLHNDAHHFITIYMLNRNYMNLLYSWRFQRARFTNC